MIFVKNISNMMVINDRTPTQEFLGNCFSRLLSKNLSSCFKQIKHNSSGVKQKNSCESSLSNNNNNNNNNDPLQRKMSTASGYKLKPSWTPFYFYFFALGTADSNFRQIKIILIWHNTNLTFDVSFVHTHHWRWKKNI